MHMSESNERGGGGETVRIGSIMSLMYETTREFFSI